MSSATIRPIDRASIHRITSGQVVIDLPTAVKELVENSLDAGATNLDVRFKDHGVTSIEVIDNGTGISEEDFESIALKSHTSKLSTHADLCNLHTFGFRGEALSAMCALCGSVTLTTATSPPLGTKLEFGRTGKVTGKSKVARQRGTSITLSELFTPLPVRRQELVRNSRREFGHALSILHAYALGPCASKGVRLTVSNAGTGGDGKGKDVKSAKAQSSTTQLRTPGTPGVRPAAQALWGPRALDGVVDLDLKFEVPAPRVQSALASSSIASPQSRTMIQVRVHGLISQFTPGSGRTGSDRQFFFVNGRPCVLGKIQKAINEVYRGFSAGHTPLVIADFELPTDAYDVNVTPDKRTIFLHSETDLISGLKTALETHFSPSRAIYDISTAVGGSQSQITTHANTSIDTHANERRDNSSGSGTSHLVPQQQSKELRQTLLTGSISHTVTNNTRKADQDRRARLAMDTSTSTRTSVGRSDAARPIPAENVARKTTQTKLNLTKFKMGNTDEGGESESESDSDRENEEAEDDEDGNKTDRQAGEGNALFLPEPESETEAATLIPDHSSCGPSKAPYEQREANANNGTNAVDNNRNDSLVEMEVNENDVESGLQDAMEVEPDPTPAVVVVDTTRVSWSQSARSPRVTVTVAEDGARNEGQEDRNSDQNDNEDHRDGIREEGDEVEEEGEGREREEGSARKKRRLEVGVVVEGTGAGRAEKPSAPKRKAVSGTEKSRDVRLNMRRRLAGFASIGSQDVTSRTPDSQEEEIEVDRDGSDKDAEEEEEEEEERDELDDDSVVEIGMRGGEGSTQRRVVRTPAIDTEVTAVHSSNTPTVEPEEVNDDEDSDSIQDSQLSSVRRSVMSSASGTHPSSTTSIIRPEIIKDSGGSGGDVRLRFDFDRVAKRWQRHRVLLNTVVQQQLDKDISAGGHIPSEASVTNADNVDEAAHALARVIEKRDFDEMEVVGQFNLGFIIVRRKKVNVNDAELTGENNDMLSSRNKASTLPSDVPSTTVAVAVGDTAANPLGQEMDDLFIVDQHAADEKYNFETLQRTTKIQSQKLFRPKPLELTAADELLAIENIDVLRQNGFELDVDEEACAGQGSRLKLTAQPLSKGTIFDTKDLEELIHLMRDRPMGHMVRCSKARAMFAMRACRKSVMVGMPLNTNQMATVVRHMGTIDQPWNCPHGRPTMRHLLDVVDLVTRTGSRRGARHREVDWQGLV